MTFLPVVERELRVSSRKRATYRTRLLTAFASIVLGSCIFLISFSMPEQAIGPRIFRGLSILGFCYCLIAGRLFTVDCLCEEKREGTLGLLFLTDLKGHDVVLGKLAATSLNGFFGLLALLPVLAVPLLMGGTTSAQFWRMALVLVVTFLFSLAIGMFGSARHGVLSRAASTNLALLLFFTIVIPLGVIAGIYFLLGPASFREIPLALFCPSPVFAFVLSFDGVYTFAPACFWLSIGIIHALTWVLILDASRVVPRSWQDQVAVAQPAEIREKKQSSRRPVESVRRAAHRKRLLDINAFYWLALRNPRKPGYVWIFLGCMAGWWMWNWLNSGAYWFDASVKITSALILNTVFKLWIVLEAGNQLAEDKKTGSIELILSSPLPVRDILRGQLLALRRQFLLPIFVVVAFQLVFFFATPSRAPDYNHVRVFLFIAAGLLMFAADIIVLPLVAMHQALAARSAAFAASISALRVLILPWILWGAIVVFIVIQSAVSPGFGRRTSLGEEALTWKFCLALWFVLGLLTDCVFGAIAWYQLRTNFRLLATAPSRSALRAAK